MWRNASSINSGLCFPSSFLFPPSDFVSQILCLRIVPTALLAPRSCLLLECLSPASVVLPNLSSFLERLRSMVFVSNLGAEKASIVRGSLPCIVTAPNRKVDQKTYRIQIVAGNRTDKIDCHPKTHVGQRFWTNETFWKKKLPYQKNNGSEHEKPFSRN